MTDTTALARRTNNGHTSLAPAGSTWTADDIALIRAQTTPPEATDAEFRQLLYMAHRYGLDPLLKQIYCVKYKGKPAQIFAGRDGFLAIAHRSGAFDGMATTVRVEQVELRVEYIVWEAGTRRTATFARAAQYVATCTVYRKGMAHPITAEVWEEEYSTGQNLWATKPRTMLAKVAECQALRKAFDISGLYDPDEIREAPPGRAATPTGEPVNAATGEIVGEAREVPADAPPALRIVPAPPDADTAFASLGPNRDDLYKRLAAVLAPLGLSNKELERAIKARHNGTGSTGLPLDTLEAECEYWENQAADVQGVAE